MLDAKIGDVVVMNDKYHVSAKNNGKEFIIASRPWNLCGTMVVRLEGVSGGYALDGLNLVKRGKTDNVGVFDVFKRMSNKNNRALKLSPLSNVKTACSGKDGWGTISMAMPNEVITDFLINPDFYIGGFLICKKDEYEKEKQLAESEE